MIQLDATTVPDAQVAPGTVVAQSSGRPWVPVWLAAAAVLGTAGIATVDPHTHNVPLCPFHALTGLWCPLCGSLRAVYDLSRADVGRALSENALFVIAVPLLLVWWAKWLGAARQGRPGAPVNRNVMISVGVIAVIFAVVRNVPIGSWLAP